MFAFLKRDFTLTGRTNLWELAWIMIQQKPLLGYGYSAFWLGSAGESFDIIRQFVTFSPSHAHNGYLDLLLNLGFLGLGAYILCLSELVAKSWKMIRSCSGSYALWIPIFITYISLFNVIENTIIAVNNLHWILFVSGYISVHWQTQRVIANQRFVRTMSYLPFEYTNART